MVLITAAFHPKTSDTVGALAVNPSVDDCVDGAIHHCLSSDDDDTKLNRSEACVPSSIDGGVVASRPGSAIVQLPRALKGIEVKRHPLSVDDRAFTVKTAALADHPSFVRECWHSRHTTAWKHRLCYLSRGVGAGFLRSPWIFVLLSRRRAALIPPFTGHRHAATRP